MGAGNKDIQGSLNVSRDLHVGGESEFEGNVRLGHNLKVKGWLDAMNIIGAMKGLFKDLESLKEAFPQPEPGLYAYVGSSLPAELWVSEGGEWHNTGTMGGEEIRIIVDGTESFNWAISSIALNDLDSMGATAIDYCLGKKPNVYRVTTDDGRRVVGILVVFSDDANHQLTQVFTTHMALDSDGTFKGHVDTEVYQYYRSWGISSPHIPNRVWSAWQKLNPLATPEKDGLMSAKDKEKLDTVARNANHYELPVATASSRGGVVSHRTGTMEGRDYYVEVNINTGEMHVNVPWQNTDTKYDVVTAEKDGLVPHPDMTRGDTAIDKFLNSKTLKWELPPNASGSNSGYMSVDDKKKLDNIAPYNLIGEIDWEDVNTMDSTTFLNYVGALGDGKPCRLLVRLGVMGNTTRKSIAGVMDVFSDEAMHQLTQVLTTHMVIDGEGNYQGHKDTEVYQYYRSWGYTSPFHNKFEWSQWQPLYPIATPERDGLMSKEDKKILDSLGGVGRVGEIDWEDLNTMDAQTALAYVQGTAKPCRLIVKYRSLNPTHKPIVGVLDIFGDEANHQLTEVFTTHMVIDEDGNYKGHVDTEVYQYYRSWGISSPHIENRTWSKWQRLHPKTIGVCVVKAKSTSDFEVMTELSFTQTEDLSIPAAIKGEQDVRLLIEGPNDSVIFTPVSVSVYNKRLYFTFTAVGFFYSVKMAAPPGVVDTGTVHKFNFNVLADLMDMAE